MPQDFAQVSLKDLQARYTAPGAAVTPQVLRRLRRDPRAGAQKLHAVLARRFEEQGRERRRIEAMLHFEGLLWKAGVTRIAGVDEVGVGPLAGPVVAAAVVFPPGVRIDGVDDSKVLAPDVRDSLDEVIRRQASGIGIGVVEAPEIDRVNIYHAGIGAMQQALSNLPDAPQHVLVDSRTIPDLAQPQNSFHKGDGINFSIACASIVAKVYRDRLMTELDAAYPGYGFSGHKGYATPEHCDAIRRLGPCPIHRRSFDYIRELCGGYSELFYALKSRGAGIGSARDLAAWEARLREARPELSPMESRKLHLMASRLWKRVRKSAG